MAVVNQKDLVEAFAARGWRVAHGSYGELRSGDRVLCAVLSKRSPSFPFTMGGWLTTDAISAAYTSILHPGNRRADSVPLVHSPRFEISSQVATDAEIDGVCAGWLGWASGADLDAGMAALLDKDANRSGAMPARHLAALAASGSIEVLESYWRAFAEGDRIGFVNYITAEHIAAALAFAQRRHDEPGWLPRMPRLRV